MSLFPSLANHRAVTLFENPAARDARAASASGIGFLIILLGVDHDRQTVLLENRVRSSRDFDKLVDILKLRRSPCRG